MRAADRDGCRLVREARDAAGRALTAKEQAALIGDLEYTPTCSGVATP